MVSLPFKKAPFTTLSNIFMITIDYLQDNGMDTIQDYYTRIVATCGDVNSITAGGMIEALTMEQKVDFLTWCEIECVHMDMPEILDLSACANLCKASLHEDKLIDSVTYYIKNYSKPYATSAGIRLTLKDWRRLARPEYNSLLDNILYEKGLPALHQTIITLINS